LNINQTETADSTQTIETRF